jgi:alpha-ketoglutarate-dependent taurine dioxygenase
VLVRELHPRVAAAIDDVDVRSLDDDGIDAIEAALAEHPVLVMRTQRLEPRQLAAFAQRLGAPELFPPEVAHPSSAMVTVISNRVGPGRGAPPYWHSDGLLRVEPPLRTVFFAEAVPPSGGETLFASTEAAYEALDAESRAQLDELVLVLPGDVRHPLVRQHPRTGRRALCINAGATIGIVGVTRESAARLLEELVAHVARPDAVYRHRYEEGDLLLWDNVAAAHSATEAVDPTLERVMLRCDVNAA